MADSKQPVAQAGYVPFPQSQQPQPAQQQYYAAAGPGPVLVQAPWPSAPPAGPYDPAGPLVVGGGGRRRRSACARFWTTFAVAIVAWTLVEVIAGFVVHRTMRHRWPPHGPPNGDDRPPESLPGPGDWSGIIPYDIQVRDCLEMPPSAHEQHPEPTHFHEKDVSLTLPTDSTFVYVGGPGLSGTLNIVPGLKDSSEIRVDVKAAYDRPFWVDRMRVCTYERNDGTTGLGVYTPRVHNDHHGHHREDQVRLNMTMFIPANHAMERLDTSLTAMRHNIDDLSAAGISFKDLKISSTAGSTSSKSVSAHTAAISSTAGSIRGKFNVTSYLELSTVSGSISATINASNSKSDQVTGVNLTSVSGQIHSDLKLYEVDSDLKGGRYGVHAKTVSGAINVEFHEQPMNSTLTLNAESISGGVHTSLHPAYVGSFSASATWAGASVDYGKKVEDPSGNQRTRSVLIGKASPRAVEGRVYWGKEGDESSDSTVDVSVVSGAARIVL